ncbi:MAG TPA: glycerate kinase [Bryobacteraceae bacterium]|nr:glycerate kinase [Bryobacteraceae bacterium]
MRKHALQMFRAALQAADPSHAIARYFTFDGKILAAGRKRYRISQFDRIQVIGAGKASAAMARAVERILGRRVSGGFINVKDASTHLRRIIQHESGHPVPDQRGLEGARRIAEIAREAGERDLLICVISGGASALMPLPSAGISLDAIQDTTRQLLACGATIHELNTVRKHVEDLKGGQLAQLAAPATVIALILSDVVGDDLDVIGSGPTVADTSTSADAAAMFTKYGIVPLPLHETPKQLTRVQNLIVGSNRQAIDAAAQHARELGYRTLVLSTFIEGETRDVASVHAAIAKEILASSRPVRPPACILSGGETTVTVRGPGLGGRNQEFVLAASIALERSGPATIFSAGTDGSDGPTDAAGAIADETTVPRARALGLDPRQFLEANDSYHFFEKLNALIKTGPTGTNVMDIRVLLIP